MCINVLIYERRKESVPSMSNKNIWEILTVCKITSITSI